MSLRTRLLIVVLGVFLVVFVSITTIFNVLMDNYIGRTATAQLSAAVAQQHFFPQQQGQDVNGQGVRIQIPDLSKAPASRFNIHPAVFTMNDDYEVTLPRNVSAQEARTARAIVATLRAHHVEPATLGGHKVRAGASTFYVQSKVLESVAGTDTATAAAAIPSGAVEYLVFYVDVTGIANFAASVNLFLMLIMVVAIIITFLVTFFITRRMTRPLADLTEFSARIGQGDFTPCTESFHDRELATLAHSMNQAAVQLDSYDKDQKTFFQNASHELRTPLMSIKCYAEGIVYDVMDAKKASGTILSETDRLSEMVEDLLAVSRIDTIAGDQRSAMCDLRELLSAAADEQRAVAERNQIELVFDFDEAPVMLWANEKTLQRAFSNLISNALRYGRSKVTLSCKQEGEVIKVIVADDGPGIDPEVQPHLFERFSKGADGKHGIGLSIVKSVVDRHEGTIEAASDAAGASFTLTFKRR
ncbi:MAG: HAMP domain-containing histidine kinase [Coriobacteriia bacterium]|nr:HAMP domain-containing histidine kinase [Coriobacteriia bacterium]